MINLIPAWYGDRLFQEKEQEWYLRKQKSDVDETVRHLQLFHHEIRDGYQLLLLGYCPNLRHFLHRQNIFSAPYWSCFDATMQIRSKAVSPFSFHSLDWPEGISFIYTSTSVLAMLDQELYARVVFGEDGNMIRVEMYEEGILAQTNVYDDRGFLSSMLVYDQQQPLYQEYLMESGEWKLRHLIQDDVVIVNKEYPEYTISINGNEQNFYFLKEAYSSMEALLAEVTDTYIRQMEGEAVFLVAADIRHHALTKKLLKDHRKILTFSSAREEQTGLLLEAFLRKEQEEQVIVTDSPELEEMLQKELCGEKNRVMYIESSYLTPENGISTRMREMSILIPMDGLEERRLQRLLLSCGRYLMRNRRTHVCLLTRTGGEEKRVELQRKFRNLWNAHELPYDRLQVMLCVDETDCEKCIREQRLIVDLGEERRDSYVQFLGLKYGVPMICAAESPYCEDGSNGKVIHNMESLPDALSYYLESLTHWNQAMVEARDLGEEFAPDELMEEWKEVMGDIG